MRTLAFFALHFATLLIAVSAIAASSMGGEFIPSLDEGDVSMEIVRIPGTSLTQSVEIQGMLERQLLGVPEVKEVFARTGTAEVATDLMPPSASDGYVMLKPRKDWPDPGKSKAAVVLDIQAAAEDVPGSVYGISQPIQQRMNESVVETLRTFRVLQYFCSCRIDRPLEKLDAAHFA